MKQLLFFIAGLFPGTIDTYGQKKPLPVIDMHLHAMPVKGSTPAIIGAPFCDLGLHDPKQDYADTYNNALWTTAGQRGVFKISTQTRIIVSCEYAYNRSTCAGLLVVLS